MSNGAGVTEGMVRLSHSPVTPPTPPLVTPPSVAPLYSLPFYFGDVGEAPGDEVTLRGPEAHHAGVVRRLAPGEKVTVTDGLGHGAVAVVETVSKSEVGLRVESLITSEEPDLWVMIAQAVPKTDRAELAAILRKMSSERD